MLNSPNGTRKTMQEKIFVASRSKYHWCAFGNLRHRTGTLSGRKPQFCKCETSQTLQKNVPNSTAKSV